MKDKIINWLAFGERGASSEAIAFKMLGKDGKWPAWTPSDPSDFKRCLKLLRDVPEIRPRLHEMRDVSERWAKLIDRWDEVEACFMEEVSGWLDDKDQRKSATKTYALMKEIGL